ncbi:RNA polymerase sigma factor [Streptomyces sp. NPDC002659]|uniref:RNA polymerase sigma factor n=1 Tax=Streptomyces sp. NPDC002659 TaxID=3364656 RepID=UPI00368E3731
MLRLTALPGLLSALRALSSRGTAALQWPKAARVADRFEGRRRRAGASDVTLAQSMRQGHPGALALLIGRHYVAVRGYLSTCFTEPHTVDHLTEETFRRAYVSVRNGGDVLVVWRPQLFATARTLAMTTWAREPRSTTATAGFCRWASSGGGWPIDGPAALSDAYRTLPLRWRTALWHAVVEGESPALVLGLPLDDAHGVKDRAKQVLRDFYLATYRQAVEHRLPCGLFALDRMERSGAPPVDWFRTHLFQCRQCHDLEFDLTYLDHRLRAQLPGELLGWWSDGAYRRAAKVSSLEAVDRARSIAARNRVDQRRRL